MFLNCDTLERIKIIELNWIVENIYPIQYEIGYPTQNHCLEFEQNKEKKKNLQNTFKQKDPFAYCMALLFNVFSIGKINLTLCVIFSDS